MRDIPVETLRALLRLNPETGTLYWRERGVEWFRDGKQTATHASRRWNSRNSGREVPASPANGYLRVCVLKTLMRYHRVVFAMHHGRWPAAHVDHKDGNSLNNRPANLREATNQENSRNSRPRRGTSPFKGVSWSTSRERWVAHCRSRNFPEEVAA